MLKIFICDDEKPILKHITEQVKKQILINEYDMEVECSCESPVALLETLKKIRERGNIYLLDVELKHPEYDGFLLGKEIRNTDPQGIIIYITSFRNLAFKTFQYHIEAFDYIVKDADKMDRSVAECLKAVTERLREESSDNSACYTFRSGDVIHHIPLDDILYFETSSRSHFVILRGKKQWIEFMGNLSDIADELGERFLKIHRSYVIAVDKIENINLKAGTVTVGGHECPVSRKAKSELLRRLEQ